MTEAPLVLCFSGHDPSGGAGLQADIEAIVAQRAQAATVVTALTVQNSLDVHAVHPVAPALIEAQAEAVFADLQPRAIKLGLLGDAANARTLAQLLQRHEGLPVVLDPVLRASGGRELADAALLDALRSELLPRCFLVTPNANEARRLSGEQDPARCAEVLLGLGAQHVLITGGDEPTARVENRLYSRDGTGAGWDWPRLPGRFHGTGCTLAAALAARLALGEELLAAAANAQQYVADCLRRARRIGQGQLFPARL